MQLYSLFVAAQAHAVPNETAPAEPWEDKHPQLKLETETKIGKHGETKIVSDLEFHPNKKGDGCEGPQGPPGPAGNLMISHGGVLDGFHAAH